MKSNNLILSVLMTSLLTCCVSSIQKNKFEVYGHSLGDSISSDFQVVKVQDFPFSRAILINDERVEVSLINNHISAIYFEELTPKEHSNLKKIITTKMKSDPVYYKGETPYDVKIAGEAFFWKNSLGTEVLLCRNPKNDTVLSYLSIYNQTLSDSLLNLYVGNIDTCDYKIINVPPLPHD